MTKIYMDPKKITKDDYNFIISNIILNQEKDFTYNDILSQITKLLGYTNKDLEYAIEKCLVRLRDYGYLDVLGSLYSPSTVYLL